jgi:hypothetical protein
VLTTPVDEAMDLPLFQLGNAYAVSADGMVTFGSAHVPNENGTGSLERAARWDLSGTLQLLEPDPSVSSWATATNCDGSVAAIASSSLKLWSATEGLRVMPSFGPGLPAWVSAFSADGSVAVGAVQSALGVAYPVTFAVNAPPTLLSIESNIMGLSADGTLALLRHASSVYWERFAFLVGSGGGFAFPGEPGGLSADGRVVVGVVSSANLQMRPIRWSRDSSMLELPCLPPLFPGFGSSCTPLFVSSKGNVIGGLLETPFISTFLWDARHGTRDLMQMLIEYGLDLSEVEDLMVSDMSDDGRVLVGRASDLTLGRIRPFRIVLPADVFD